MANLLSGFSAQKLTSSIDNAIGQKIRQILPDGTGRQDNDVTNTTVTPTASTPSSLSTAEILATPASVTENYRSSKNAAVPSRGLGTFGSATSKPETIATISVSTSKKVLLSNYSQFFLQTVSEGDQEKYQVVETFTAYYVFFFGRRPLVYRFSGMLLNDDQYNWMNDFKYAYENMMRGTAAAEVGASVVISYDKRVITCFPLSLNIQQDAMLDKGVPFSMDVLVITHDYIDFSSDLKTFIDNKQNELNTLKNQIQSEAARMKKNVNPEQAFIKQLVLTKGFSPSSILGAGQKATDLANPPTQKKSQYDTSPDEASIDSFQKLLTPVNVPGNQ